MIVVIGQPRTGTSLAMQMLHAAGAECLGPWPSFEIPFEQWSADHYAAVSDPKSAAKYVWHARPAIPLPPDTRFVVTSRHPKQQQASESKFLHLLAGMRHPDDIDRNQRRLMRKRYIAEQLKVDRFVGNAGRYFHTPIEIPFELAIQKPDIAAALLCEFVGFGDPDTVAAVVESRDPSNYPGMLEAKLIEKALE